MAKCSVCGKTIHLLHQCSYCGDTFCDEHSLPENHHCVGLPRAPPPQIRDRIPVPKPEPRPPSRASREPIEEEPPDPSELLRAMEKQYKHLLEAKRKSTKIIVALCVMVVLVPLIVGYGFYNVGSRTSYEPGYAAGYEAGHLTGYGAGWQNGSIWSYEQGYNGGLFEGNQTGYSLGNSSGFTNGFGNGYSEGNSSGYQSGYLQGVKDGAGRGYNVRDPTYQEMTNFIAADKTNLNTYHYPDYVCWNYAADTINDAFKNGYRCGHVYIDFIDGYAHAVICFNTTDHGLVFIEPQNDAIVQIAVGSYYSFTSETIARYGIIW